MDEISRRQFIRVSAAAGIGTLLTALAPEGQCAAQAPALEPIRPDPAPSPAAWPLGTVPRNQTFVYSYSNLSSIFNPLNSSYNHQLGNAVLYEPCAFYNPLSGMTVLWLAESYQYNTDATELTITFRNGIQWSDGTPFTMDDAIWTINALRNVAGLQGGGNITAELSSVTILNSRTIKIVLKQTDWRFFNKVFTYRQDLGDVAFVPKSVFNALPVNQLATFEFYDLANQWPITTGPYGVGEITTDHVNYDRRSSWWAVQTGFLAEMPQVARFQSQYFSDQTTEILKLVNDDVDTSLDLSPSLMRSVIVQNSNITTWTGDHSPYGNIDWWPISVYFNNLKPPYNDKRVRWAIAYAIDQQGAINTAWGGDGIVTGQPFPTFSHLMPYINGISDLLTTYNVLEHDLTKTNSLMTAAGFTKDAQGYWIDGGGVRPDANLYAPVPLFADLGPAIAQQLRAAGFDCTSVSPVTVWNDMADGTASLFLWGHGGATYDPLDTFNLYRPENIQPIGTESWANMARWSNPTFTQKADQMSAISPDDPGMAALFHDGMAVWLNELPDCPICQWIHRIPVNTRYWVNYPNQSNLYAAPSLWHLTALEVLVKLKMNLPYRAFLPLIKR